MWQTPAEPCIFQRMKTEAELKQLCSALNNNYFENRWRSSFTVGWSWWWLTEHLLHCNSAGIKFLKWVAPDRDLVLLRENWGHHKRQRSPEMTQQTLRQSQAQNTTIPQKGYPTDNPHVLTIYTNLPQTSCKNIKWTDLGSKIKTKQMHQNNNWHMQ